MTEHEYNLLLEENAKPESERIRDYALTIMEQSECADDAYWDEPVQTVVMDLIAFFENANCNSKYPIVKVA